MNIQAQLTFGDTVNGEFVECHISEPKDNLGSWTTELRKNGKGVGNLYGESRDECKSMAGRFANPDEYEHIGYYFNGRFYKSEHELRGNTMSDENQPKPVYIKKH